jgi:hypothetical protein
MSSKAAAAFSMSNFLFATVWISGGMLLKAFLGKPSKRALVDVSPNDAING